MFIRNHSNPQVSRFLQKGFSEISEGIVGKALHALCVKDVIQLNTFYTNTLVNMYSKFGSIKYAQHVFDKMYDRNDSSWNNMMSGFARVGWYHRAMQFFCHMFKNGITPSSYVIASLVTACDRSGCMIEEARQIHDYVVKCGLMSNVFVGTSLLHFYGTHGSVSEANKLFEEIEEPNIVSWTSLMVCYADNGHTKEVLNIYRHLRHNGLICTGNTMATVIRTCGMFGDKTMGYQILGDVVKSGLDSSSVSVANSLISMFGNFDSVEEASCVFNNMKERDTISWNSIITASAHNGRFEESLGHFFWMRRTHPKTNYITISALLPACGSAQHLKLGRGLHGLITKSGLESNVCVCNSLLSMYSQAGSSEDAEFLFHTMPERDLISWNSMMASHVEDGKYSHAILLLIEMLKTRKATNYVTFTTALSACNNLEKLKIVHAFVIHFGVHHSLIIGNTLVTMYGKYGLMDEAQKVCKIMPERDLVTWNALIGGHADDKDPNAAIQAFNLLRREVVSSFLLLRCEENKRKMEKREDWISILPYLPVVMRSASLFWPSQVVEALRELRCGRVDSGRLLFIFITELRNSLSLSTEPLAPSAEHGYALFFDELISREECRKWFEEVLPALGDLLLRLPSLLEAHYENADMVIDGKGATVRTGLRMLDSQEAGIMFLTQELIAALLACSFLCLFPVHDRYEKQLQPVNFDELFASLYNDYTQKQEYKIWCIIHYFQRITSDMPKGVVSFERKVLPWEDDCIHISYPNASFWSTSVIPLCRFEVQSSGLIEDHSIEAVEVDFANEYLGGGALRRGCVQEEIRFMISPELIAGMIFLPAMADNEAIDIVGVERFSSYTGYASSFRFSGDYVDDKDVDALGRRKTRIVAIDALCGPGMRQYREKFLLREINKAFCGFLQQSKYQRDQKIPQENFDAMETSEGKCSYQEIRNPQNDYDLMENSNDIGVATGNWGCGAFGGDPEVKAIIQWLAASQAGRPFIAYYTFGSGALQNLEKVACWILSQRWTVGDLWNMLVEYSTSRSKGDTNVGFLQWLLPSIYDHGSGMD